MFVLCSWAPSLAPGTVALIRIMLATLSTQITTQVNILIHSATPPTSSSTLWSLPYLRMVHAAAWSQMLNHRLYRGSKLATTTTMHQLRLPPVPGSPAGALFFGDYSAAMNPQNRAYLVSSSASSAHLRRQPSSSSLWQYPASYTLASHPARPPCCQHGTSVINRCRCLPGNYNMYGAAGRVHACHHLVAPVCNRLAMYCYTPTQGKLQAARGGTEDAQQTESSGGYVACNGNVGLGGLCIHFCIHIIILYVHCREYYLDAMLSWGSVRIETGPVTCFCCMNLEAAATGSCT